MKINVSDAWVVQLDDTEYCNRRTMFVVEMCGWWRIWSFFLLVFFKIMLSYVYHLLIWIYQFAVCNAEFVLLFVKLFVLFVKLSLFPACNAKFVVQLLPLFAVSLTVETAASNDKFPALISCTFTQTINSIKYLTSEFFSYLLNK